MATSTSYTLDTVLVVGPTGSIGKSLCRALIAHRSQFARIAAFDNQSSRPGATNTGKDALFEEYRKGGMEIVQGTYDDPSAFEGSLDIMSQF